MMGNRGTRNDEQGMMNGEQGMRNREIFNIQGDTHFKPKTLNLKLPT